METLRKLIFEEKNNVFLTGPGGTGKTTMLKDIFLEAKESGVIVELTATTGVAAYNLGGVTVHRWSGLQTGEADIDTLIANIEKYKFDGGWKAIQLLIIDEISMLGKRYFELLHCVASHFRNNYTPLGGVQLLVSGDFLQLPPVNDAYCFESELWDALDFQTLELCKPYRYPDPNYFSLLLRVRKGMQTKQDIKFLQSRVIPVPDGVRPTMLFSKRQQVDSYNKSKLAELKTQEHTYEAEDSYIDKRKYLERKRSINFESYFRDIVSKTITFKVNCQVMLTQNIAIEDGLVNGARGTVTALSSDGVTVLFDHATEPILIGYRSFDIRERNLTVSRKQIPLILAHSVTIHKIQGCTLESCAIDLGGDIFSANMAYVALSRCRTAEGLFLTKLKPESIYAKRSALEFEDSFE